MVSFSKQYLSYYPRKLPHFQDYPVLLPVWVWKVLAPIPVSTPELNVFQRTVLSFLEAGKTDSVEIAEWMGVERELVLLIMVNELQSSRGLIDDNFKLTAQGLTVLNKSLDHRRDLNRLTHCYMFQDALTGEIWPRIANNLRDIEPVREENGFPILQRDRNSGKELRPFVVAVPSRARPNAPSVEEFRKAAQKHNVAFDNQSMRGQGVDFWTRVSVDEFEFSGATPEPAYVLTHFMNSEHPEHLCGLQDPLHISQLDPWIHKLHLTIARSSASFAQKAMQFTGLDSNENETLALLEQRIHKEVEFALMIEFPNIDRVAHLATYVEAIHRRQKMIEELAAQGRLPHFSELEELIGQCQKANEACFKFMLREWRFLDDSLITPQTTRSDLRRSLHQYAGQYYSQLDLDRFEKVQPRNVFSAIGYSTGKFTEPNVSLQPLLVATLLGLADHPNHPFVQIPASLRALADFEALMNDRNSAAHASGQHVNVTTACQHAVFTLKWIQSFLQNLGTK